MKATASPFGTWQFYSCAALSGSAPATPNPYSSAHSESCNQPLSACILRLSQTTANSQKWNRQPSKQSALQWAHSASYRAERARRERATRPGHIRVLPVCGRTALTLKDITFLGEPAFHSAASSAALHGACVRRHTAPPRRASSTRGRQRGGPRPHSAVRRPPPASDRSAGTSSGRPDPCRARLSPPNGHFPGWSVAGRRRRSRWPAD